MQSFNGYTSWKVLLGGFRRYPNPGRFQFSLIHPLSNSRPGFETGSSFLSACASCLCGLLTEFIPRLMSCSFYESCSRCPLFLQGCLSLFSVPGEAIVPVATETLWGVWIPVQNKKALCVLGSSTESTGTGASFLGCNVERMVSAGCARCGSFAKLLSLWRPVKGSCGPISIGSCRQKGMLKGISTCVPCCGFGWHEKAARRWSGT